jgi:hypothetical protein
MDQGQVVVGQGRAHRRPLLADLLGVEPVHEGRHEGLDVRADLGRLVDPAVAQVAHLHRVVAVLARGVELAAHAARHQGVDLADEGLAHGQGLPVLGRAGNGVEPVGLLEVHDLLLGAFAQAVQARLLDDLGHALLGERVALDGRGAEDGPADEFGVQPGRQRGQDGQLGQGQEQGFEQDVIVADGLAVEDAGEGNLARLEGLDLDDGISVAGFVGIFVVHFVAHNSMK